MPGVKGNFGDELNDWLWNRLAPETFAESSDPTLFLGIGTILSANLPAAPRYVVFGSGVGYGPPPIDRCRGDRWQVYGVRGELTQRLLDLPTDRAMTDPAILLAACPELRNASSTRRGIAFVPHWKSMNYGFWDAVCQAAGIRLIDPCQDAKQVIHQIQDAELVIAESMHAAIVADTFRVPWIPVLLSPEVSAFKWRDWASSLALPYAPVQLPASSFIEATRTHLVRYVNPEQGLEPERAALLDPEALIESYLRSNGNDDRTPGQGLARWGEIVLKRLSRVERGLRLSRSVRIEQCAASLRRAASGPSHLSTDRSHADALSLTQERLARLCRAESAPT